MWGAIISGVTSLASSYMEDRKVKSEHKAKVEKLVKERLKGVEPTKQGPASSSASVPGVEEQKDEESPTIAKEEEK